MFVAGRTLILVILAFLGPLGVMAQSPASPSSTPGSPSEVADGIIVVRENGMVGVTEPIPLKGQVNGPHMFVLDVWLGPNGIPGTTMHPHSGASIINVIAGAICYEQGFIDKDALVTASIPAGPQARSTCPQTTKNPCPSDNTRCQLWSGDTIYLPVGSIVTLSGAIEHTYYNPDPSIAAVTRVSEYQDGDPTVAPCGSRCH